MSQLHNLIANGGKVLVVGGYNKSWPEFRDHPQLVFWTGETNEIESKVTAGYYPDNLKAVVVSRFISHKSLNPILKEARNKKATIFAPLGDGELRKVLKEITENSIIPEKKKMTTPEIETVTVASERAGVMMRPAVKGEVAKYVRENHKDEGTTAEEANRIVKIMKADGIEPPYDVTYRAVWFLRKNPLKKEKVEKVKTGRTKKQNNQLLTLIDDAIAAMKLVREEVKKLDTQQTDYLKLKDRLKEILS